MAIYRSGRLNECPLKNKAEPHILTLDISEFWSRFPMHFAVRVPNNQSLNLHSNGIHIESSRFGSASRIFHGQSPNGYDLKQG